MVKIRIKRIVREFVSIINANNIISTYPNIKAKEHKVNLLDYNLDEAGIRHYNAGVPYNLGDELGKVVIDWMLERSNRGLSRDMWVKKKKFFLSIGSGLLFSYQDATFWGTGVERDDYPLHQLFFHRNPLRKLDIRAVRGPLSREMIIKLGHKCPEVYGDPAILMPLIYKPDVEKCHDYAVIPQYYTEGKVRDQYKDEFIISMNTNNYKEVIDKIVSCRKVITSSLHGIILAEAYGIPAIWYRGLRKSVDFKYRDWYYSTNRHEFPIATSIEEALLMEPPAIPNLTDLQKGIMEVFPYDLWEQ